MTALEYIGVSLGVVSLIAAFVSIAVALVATQRAKTHAEQSKDFYEKAMRSHDETKTLLLKIGIISDEIKTDIHNLDEHTKFTLQQIENQATKIGVTLDSSQKTLVDTISKIALVNSKQNEKFQIGTQELMTQMIIESSKRQSSSEESIKMLEVSNEENQKNYEE